MFVYIYIYAIFVCYYICACIYISDYSLYMLIRAFIVCLCVCAGKNICAYVYIYATLCLYVNVFISA